MDINRSHRGFFLYERKGVISFFMRGLNGWFSEVFPLFSFKMLLKFDKGDYRRYSDEELVRLLAQEDRKAFDELYHRYWSKLILQAKIKLDSETDAEEIVQDVFVGLWKRRKSLDLKYTFYSYIASCVKYEIFSLYAKREKNKLFVSGIEAAHQLNANATQDWMDYDSVRSTIEETVQSLPEKCRLVFRLSREEGLSHQEIADKLHISTKTVEAHISKALRLIGQSISNLTVVSFVFWEYMSRR
jgi:RNA polymerase sigma-70 factor (family 1)